MDAHDENNTIKAFLFTFITRAFLFIIYTGRSLSLCFFSQISCRNHLKAAMKWAVIEGFPILCPHFLQIICTKILLKPMVFHLNIIFCQSELTLVFPHWGKYCPWLFLSLLNRNYLQLHPHPATPTGIWHKQNSDVGRNIQEKETLW